ncbi:NifB/NifX family molybdenum-iron cluster-binding protein [Candidatus Methanoprimaticola sp. MG2]|uniref:NifB/NifX family molybdenum-iron cluster-binding protein n=1 Tax=Candidatus Methanoprimaticola sp. MG2 TaxID=3228838 RepID=UPI0039C5FFB1
MRIIAVSEGESLDSYVADDFGHAPFFLLVDSETLDYSVIVNEFMDSESGAGMAVARAISGLGGVDAVLTGGIGMHGIEILRKAGIDVSSDEEGTVEEAIRDYIRRVERRKKFESMAG